MPADSRYNLELVNRLDSYLSDYQSIIDVMFQKCIKDEMLLDTDLYSEYFMLLESVWKKICYCIKILDGITGDDLGLPENSVKKASELASRVRKMLSLLQQEAGRVRISLDGLKKNTEVNGLRCSSSVIDSHYLNISV